MVFHIDEHFSYMNRGGCRGFWISEVQCNCAVTSLFSDQSPSLADGFDYVMYGKMYRIEGGDDSGRL